MFAVLFVLALALAITAPALRRYQLASALLATGAFLLVLLALIGLTHLDPKMGGAANQADRRFYRMVLACEVPVFVLALISRKGFKVAFWLAWAINLAFTLFLIVLAVWLEFFWHW